MTERLYYFDSYTTEFLAQVVERLTHHAAPAVILDKTYFYPSSGGQPHDTGFINESSVIEVFVRETDGAAVHVLSQPVNGESAQCKIDWERRFDHMQQHTGQHILSQAFLRAAEAETVSFHLGLDNLTIDIAADRLAPEQLQLAERLANEQVMADVAVKAWFPSEDELNKLTLRKTPGVSGALRLVAVGDFDLIACGGTHVAHTGEIGQIKIIKTEKQKKATRIEFKCGWRALNDYRLKNDLVSGLAADFTCGYWEVGDAVARLRSEAQGLRKELKAACEQLLDGEASALLDNAQTIHHWRVVRAHWHNRDIAELRGLATRLTAGNNVVALLGASGARSQLVFACSSDVTRNMGDLLKKTLAVIPGGRGGGDAWLAQGGGAEAPAEQIEMALTNAEKELPN